MRRRTGCERSSSKTWNSPLSMIVSSSWPSESEVQSASRTRKLVRTPRSAALRRAISMARRETSIPSALALWRAQRGSCARRCRSRRRVLPR